MNSSRKEKKDGFVDFPVHVSRVAKVVKGGRRFSFSVLIVSGNGEGRVGIGVGKAGEVPEAIRKGTEGARKRMLNIPIVNNTLPHEVIGHFGSGRVILKPASEGTGVIAGGGVRAVLEAVGVHNVLSKSLGSRNPHNLVRATMDALSKLIGPEEAMRWRGRAPELMLRKKKGIAAGENARKAARA